MTVLFYGDEHDNYYANYPPDYYSRLIAGLSNTYTHIWLLSIGSCVHAIGTI